MKNVIKLLVIITLASVITFTMTSCGDGPGGGGNNNGGVGGNGNGGNGNGGVGDNGNGGNGNGGVEGNGNGAGARGAYTSYDEAGNKYTLAFSGSGRSVRAAGNDNNQGDDNDQGKKGDKYTITVTGPGGNTIGTNEGKIDNVEDDGIYTLKDDSDSFTVETTEDRHILRFPKVINLGNGKHHEVNGHLSNDGQKVEIREVTVPGSSLADKLAWLKANAQSNTRYTVNVDKNETLDGTCVYGNSLFYVNPLNDINYLEYPSRGNVTVLLIGASTVSLSPKGTLYSFGALFYVGSGVTLELENVTLQGMNYGNDCQIVIVRSASLIMQGNSKITGSFFGGVSIYKGTFIMKDNAEVYTNSGGGVYAWHSFTIMQDNVRIYNNIGMNLGYSGVCINNGTFTMNGGEIFGNNDLGSDGGGVKVEYNGTFIMNGGKIYNNIASNMGGGIFVDYYSTFIMNGGEIYGNKVTHTLYKEYGGGGGVYNRGIFHITNGTIYGSDESITTFRNTVEYPGTGAVILCVPDVTTAQYGNGSRWTDIPLTSLTRGYFYTDNTIKVVNGVLQ